MDAFGKGAARLAFGAACLSLVSFASAAGSWNEIEAHETPLKTTLEWTKDAKAKHFEKWSDNFTGRYWDSKWRTSGQEMRVIFTELAPNVAWKIEQPWWKNRDSAEKRIRSVVNTKLEMDVKFDSHLDCVASACIPFTVGSAWNCVYFVYPGFVRNLPKSEGVLEKDSNNDSLLEGYYCKQNEVVLREDVNEALDSFYVGSERPSQRKKVAVAPPPKPPSPGAARPAVGTYPTRPGDTFRDCPECPEMVVIPAGSFMMGSPASEVGRDDDEGPRHRVTIPRAFALGKFELTRAEFAAFVRDTGHDAQGCLLGDRKGSGDGKDKEWTNDPTKSWRDPTFTQSERDPVVCVNWDDATAYVRWLARKTSQEYRLPSEAEWEYAARAGTMTARYWGEDADRACGYGNVHDRTSKSELGLSWPHHDCRDGHAYTAPVGSFRPNDFGLHDTLGNVSEWVEDCWNDSYSGARSDGRGLQCSFRVGRGGSAVDKPKYVRTANRARFYARNRYVITGFRIARTLEPNPPSEKPPKRIARVAPAPVPEPQPDLKISSTGSGFYVSGDGYVVTNEHVVDGCKEMKLQGSDKIARQVRLIGTGANSDLALLKADFLPQSFAVIRRGEGARPGEAVAVIGFPLAGSLSSSAKITTGIVNADAGPRDDPDMLQISAPVQPGNSGGPILDAWGHLIGVVVSVIKKKKFAEAFGRPPENVNFAIKARLVRSLLDAHGVDYRTEAATTKLDPAGIYERARPFTVLIGCWK